MVLPFRLPVSSGSPAIGEGHTVLATSIPSEGHQRKGDRVEVVPEIEDTGKTGSGEPFLGPTAVRQLVIQQVADPAGYLGAVSLTGGDQSQHRPGGLGCRDRPGPSQGRIVVGPRCLSPAAAGLLELLETVGGPSDS